MRRSASNSIMLLSLYSAFYMKNIERMIFISGKMDSGMRMEILIGAPFLCGFLHCAENRIPEEKAMRTDADEIAELERTERFLFVILKMFLLLNHTVHPVLREERGAHGAGRKRGNCDSGCVWKEEREERKEAVNMKMAAGGVVRAKSGNRLQRETEILCKMWGSGAEKRKRREVEWRLRK